jgi:hypothetical protein
MSHPELHFGISAPLPLGYQASNDWIFRGMSITHSEVKPIVCSEANRSSIPRHADQRFRGQADQDKGFHPLHLN